jgi:ABC-type transport system involved in cytochrome bd biosynthesis fused ATPase/permease subunit
VHPNGAVVKSNKGLINRIAIPIYVFVGICIAAYAFVFIFDAKAGVGMAFILIAFWLGIGLLFILKNAVSEQDKKRRRAFLTKSLIVIYPGCSLLILVYCKAHQK